MAFRGASNQRSQLDAAPFLLLWTIFQLAVLHDSFRCAWLSHHQQ
jgi:hypothetical protein